MAIQVDDNGERDFSIELKSSKHLHSVLSNRETECVIIEGTLGYLQHASFVDPEIFEVKGSYGILRVYLRSSEITARVTENRNLGDDAE
ncbi:MAG: hypothetical protein ACFFED_16860 [Candidatus Thorarchaeota archaeon]